MHGYNMSGGRGGEGLSESRVLFGRCYALSCLLNNDLYLDLLGG